MKFKPQHVNFVNRKKLFAVILDLMQSTVTGTSKYFLHVKILALNLYIALNKQLESETPDFLDEFYFSANVVPWCFNIC